MRRAIIAANWKMHYGQVDEALMFVRQIRGPLNEIESLDRVLCPPFTVLPALAEVLLPTKIGLGAQNMHWDEQGAQTGEISPTMLAGLCQYVILGHSERRAMGGMTNSDEAINRKVLAAFEHGLVPIICVGEDLDQNEAGETASFVASQVQSATQGCSIDQVGCCVIAYEPIWAIGTGKSASPADVNSIIALSVRAAIAEHYGEAAAQQVRVQYGGSVNAGNIASYMAMPEIDGALVGGASLKPSFADLVRNAVTA